MNERMQNHVIGEERYVPREVYEGCHTLGQVFRRTRRHYGLTQEKMAEILGLHRVSIAKIETHVYTPSSHEIFRFCRKFYVDANIFSSDMFKPHSSKRE